MNRKEAYAKIKELNLQEEVLATYGRNYTLVKTEDLEELILQHLEEMEEKEEEYEDEDDYQEETPAKPAEQEADTPYEAALIALLGILKDCGMLDKLLKKI